jgi:hypothetical protein
VTATVAVAAHENRGLAQMFNAVGDAVFEFGVAHRNTVLWSPHGRFLCLGVRCS